MSVPCLKCGNEILGHLCSQCGYQQQSNLYNQPTTLRPVWYQDGSLWSLFLTINSIPMLWTIEWVIPYGLIPLIAFILAVLSKKKNGRIALLSIILSGIALVIDLFIIVLFLLF